MLSESSNGTQRCAVRNDQLKSRTGELEKVSTRKDAGRTVEGEKSGGRGQPRKEHVLANMSHECGLLLTPSIDIAKCWRKRRGNPESPTACRISARSNRRGNNLLSLINDVLDLSKIEAGKMG